MKIIDRALLDATTRAACGSPRRRMNHNLHERLDDPVNRLLNALEPGTFLPVHRHTAPAKDETILVLRGRVVSFVFDDKGRVVQQVEAGPETGVFGFDIPAGEWHGLLVLEPGTVVFEVKAGPYAPIAPDDIAPWSPSADDAAAVEAYHERLHREANL